MVGKLWPLPGESVEPASLPSVLGKLISNSRERRWLRRLGGSGAVVDRGADAADAVQLVPELVQVRLRVVARDLVVVRVPAPFLREAGPVGGIADHLRGGALRPLRRLDFQDHGFPLWVVGAIASPCDSLETDYRNVSALSILLCILCKKKHRFNMNLCVFSHRHISLALYFFCKNTECGADVEGMVGRLQTGRVPVTRHMSEDEFARWYGFKCSER